MEPTCCLGCRSGRGEGQDNGDNSIDELSLKKTLRPLPWAGGMLGVAQAM